MRVLHFSAHDGDTGGGLSAARIHGGLLARGIDSQLCVAQPTRRPPRSFSPPRPLSLKLRERLIRPIDAWLTERYAPLYETGVNTGFVGYDIGETVRAIRPDVVHLHWIAGDAFRFSSLSGVTTPIVWRLPDMWTFCAIEQYQSDPSQYRAGPTRRASGLAGLIDLPGIAFRNKARTYSRIGKMIVACPSQWLASEARSSRLLAERSIEVIRTACDTAQFAPSETAQARQALGLPIDGRVILIGADSLTDPRKGVDLFLQALRRLADRGPAPMLVSFGARPIDPAAIDPRVTTVHLGRIQDRRALALAYSAANAFVAPSRMENLANTVLEAMACGTPTAAFSVGGMPDMIDDRVNGVLAEPFDTGSLADGLEWLLARAGDPILRRAARDKIESQFSLASEIDGYLGLYDRLLDSRKSN